MKIIKKISSALIVILFCLTLLLPSCNKPTNPLDGTKLVINYDLIKTKLNFRFYDARTNELIGSNSNINVTAHINGAGKDAVIDITGAKLDDYSAKSNNGFMTLALNPNNEFIPTKENPITFTVVTQLDGYISTSKTIIISKENNYEFRIDMVNLSDPPEGVSIKQQNSATTANNGVIKQTVEITTNDGNASVTIKEGTVLKDSNGKLLNGNIHVMIAYFDNLTDESLQSFPGGLMPLVNQGGTTEQGVFYSAGFVAIEISDDSGKKAATIEENSISLTMNVNQETYNPETQSQVSQGDQVPLYSYEPETGEWNFEQDVSIGEGSRGLAVSVELTHLSFWNFDWFTRGICDQGINLHVNLHDNICGCAFVEGRMYKAADNSFLSWVGFHACDGENVTFLNVPSNVPVYINWNSSPYCQGIYPEVAPPSLPIPDLCEQTTYNIDVEGPAGGTTVIVDFSAYCASNPNVIIKPSFGAWYRPIDSWCWQYATMENGHSEICGVEIGQEYFIGVYFNGEWYGETVTVDQSQYIYLDIQIPADICDEVFGL